LHAYDGQVGERDRDARRAAASSGIDRLFSLRGRLVAQGLPVDRIVLGGTPTFPIHATLDVAGVECSPGTCILHDAGYAQRFPDLPFVPAAVLLTRVISQSADRLCLDLGHKAVAADPAGPRVTLLGIPDAVVAGQSEEHLVVRTPSAGQYPPGTPLLAIPTHICPTCALHRTVYVIEGGTLVDEWDVSARDRRLHRSSTDRSEPFRTGETA
jgi:D-serine deaminase-like pyridoxal phosphate-dependent protein